MPVYEFRCADCGETVDSGDRTPPPHPAGECTGAMRRVWQATVCWPKSKRGHGHSA
jgi:predicted nucleic acid-binding Zn ribbon protein